MMRRLAGFAFAVVAAVFAAPAAPCGLEDPNSIATRRGALNLAFPESLHVGTAVWQAQLAGKLPRDPLAERGDLTPEQRGAMRLFRANALLGELALHLAGAAPAPGRPSIALVLLGPVLWTRFEPTGSGVRPIVHVQGPEADDVVVVSEIAVVEAIARGGLGFGDAIDVGLVRLYGAPEQVAAARRWLTATARS